MQYTLSNNRIATVKWLMDGGKPLQAARWLRDKMAIDSTTAIKIVRAIKAGNLSEKFVVVRHTWGAELGRVVHI